jgi:hypothetical protein
MRAVMVTSSLTIAALAGGIALARSPQLVGFNGHTQNEHMQVELADSVTGERPATLHAMNTRAVNSNRPMAAAEIVKPAQMLETKAVISAQPSPQPAVAKKCAKRQAVHHATPAQDPNEQGWMVLTEWNELAEPPRPVLLRLDVRGSYAAVPVVGGWLILRI